jgi:hypothetical protein
MPKWLFSIKNSPEIAKHDIPYAHHYNPLLIKKRFRILTIINDRISSKIRKISLKTKKWSSKWGKNIHAAVYDGTLRSAVDQKKGYSFQLA